MTSATTVAFFGDGAPPSDGPGQPRRSWLRRNGGLLAIAVALVVAAGLAALALRGNSGVDLDPRSPAPGGALAVARILDSEGVTVRPVTLLDDVMALAGPQTTVLVIDQGIALPEDRLIALSDSGADVVLASPGFLTTLAVAPDLIQTGTVADTDEIDADCDDPDATAAGSVTGGGDGYVIAPDSTRAGDVVVCYPTGQGPTPDSGTYVVSSGPTGRVTLIGNSAILTNALLDEEGNAALALRALGRQPTLVWYLADPFDPALAPDGPGLDDPSLLDLLPGWVWWVTAQLLVVTALAIVWRARRLGALVPEGLPAIVRSAETAEGTARLYRRAGSRARAAALLRTEASRRLAARVGARRGSTAADIAALAASAADRDPVATAAILDGPPPATDAELVRLADELDALVAAVDTA